MTAYKDQPARRRLAALAVVLGLTLAVAACGSSSDSSDDEPTATTTTTEAMEDGDDTELELDPGQVQAELDALLLTAAEVGPNAIAGEYEVDESDAPTPCGTEGADSLVPPLAQVGAVFGTADGNIELREELRAYQDPEQAAEALDAVMAALACGTAEVEGADGAPITITMSAPVDLSDTFGDVDAAVGWDLQFGEVTAGQVVAAKGPLLMTFQYLANPGADTTLILEPVPFALLGVDKIRNS
jgi:hypothetical protein